MAKFKKFTNKLSACRICNKLTHSSIDGCLGIQLCRPCYDDGGEENMWSDHGCPECKSRNYKIGEMTKMVRGMEVQVTHDITCLDCGHQYLSEHAKDFKDGQE